MESEERFRVAVAEAPVPMLIHDEDDHVCISAKAGPKFRGIPSKIFLPWDWTDSLCKRSGMEMDYIDDLLHQGTPAMGMVGHTKRAKNESGVLHHPHRQISRRQAHLRAGSGFNRAHVGEEELRQMNLNRKVGLRAELTNWRSPKQLVRMKGGDPGQLAEAWAMTGNPMGVISNAVYF